MAKKADHPGEVTLCNTLRNAEAALCNALAEMPFGGSYRDIGHEANNVRNAIVDGMVSCAAVALYLRQLVAYVKDYCEGVDADRKRLVELERDVEGLRRIFGIKSEE